MLVRRIFFVVREQESAVYSCFSPKHIQEDSLRVSGLFLNLISMKTNFELQQDVINELRWEPLLGVGSTEIGVSAKDGVVSLSGEVSSYAKKIAAENAARRVKGVKVVAVDLNVVIPGKHTYTDIDLSKAVMDALKWHTAVEEESIKARVENGWVYLEGETKWEYQKNAAEKAIQNLAGIKGIINHIRVQPSLNAGDIKREITAAFHRSATLDAASVSIEVSNNQVILKGKVRSLAEKKDAERTAWKAPGVSEVVNKLEVEFPIFA
jgi:osmotically-inducible protein OsmY